MNWIDNIKNKMTASIVLFVLCSLVLVNNFTERNHSTQVENLLNTVYNDRLIAESYILKLSDCMHQIIEHATAEDINHLDEARLLDDMMLDVNKVNTDYGKTLLTVEEEVNFIAFKDICTQIENHNHLPNTLSKTQLSKQALTVLNTLSTIQIKETQLIIAQSDKIFSAGKLSSEFEIAIVVIIAFILQALVFASKTLSANTRSVSPYLN